MIKIYTDGSCLENPGNGGWAAIINNKGNIKQRVESLKCQSFNMSSFIILFSTCAGISTMFMYSILKYFSTDGFSTYKNSL